MNFALLGCDATALLLVRAIAADPRHRLQTAAFVPQSFHAELLSVAPGVRIESQWEGLPHDTGIDVVIAVVGHPGVDECVKQTASAGKPVLLAPNGDPASALVYELTLIRDDAHVPLVPVFPLRYCGPLSAVAEFVRNDESLEPLNLQWTREIVPTGKPGTGLLSAKDVHRALIHDADILRQLGGNYSQVTTVRSGDAQTGFSMVTVTLAGARLPTATWIARPASDGASFELSIPTNAGLVSLRGGERRAEDGGRRSEMGTALHSQLSTLNFFKIEASGTHAVVETLQSVSTGDVAKSLLDHFVNATSQGHQRKAEGGTRNAERGPTSDLRPPTSDASPDWSDLLQATEIVEAAERSVRRRRTIDLHFETTSERNQFKTQMTAIGCGLLTMTLVSLVFLLIAGALFNVHPLVMKIARIGIIVPLVLFLLLQGLLFVSRPSQKETNEG